MDNNAIVDVTERRAFWCPTPSTSALVLAATLSFAVSAAQACAPGPNKLGVSRIVEIDASEGPVFGRATRFPRQPTFLKPKEVVLTFDDGPTPGVTASVLKSLRNHCTRALFFPIGKRAVQFPDLIDRIQLDGHTLGAHTWSHPNNLRRLKPGAARDQIERGFAAVDLVSKSALAPFFRFPGLNDGRELLIYTQSRKLAVFSVDVISDDSFARSTAQLIRTTRSRTRANNGGILLFHDLKKRTAAALPQILANLKRDGFTVVHVVSALPFRRDKGYDSILEPKITSTRRRRGPVDATTGARVPLGLTVPVTTLKPHQVRFDGKAREPKPAKPDDDTPQVKIPGWRTTIGPGATDAALKGEGVGN